MQKAESAPKIEYSSREVSPAPLLLSQVLTANRIFLLHHGPSLSDLYVRISRDKFCGILDRYWTRFCRNWEVLLHGNPAVEVFGGIKLAAGGELGVGVGEEEWGSGEREVLEDLVRQTEGLVDLTVSRFGQAAASEPDNASQNPMSQGSLDSDASLPWLGSGHLPESSDGVIFGGTGAMTRNSLRSLSSWVEQMYIYGEHAYGVRDNPHRAQRKKRRRQPLFMEESAEEPAEDELGKKSHRQSESQNQKIDPDLAASLPHDPRPQMYDRVASQDHAAGTSTPQVASHPGIPPPIVTAAEQSLHAASLAAAAAAAAAAPKEQPVEKVQRGSTYGVPNKWMKYLTLGLAGSDDSEDATKIRDRSASPSSRPVNPRRTSSSSSLTVRPSASRRGSRLYPKEPGIPEGDESGPMTTLDPAPDGHELDAQIARQRYLEGKGHFLIGYKGNLDRVPTQEDEDVATDGQLSDTENDRVMIRTLQIEVPPQQSKNDEESDRSRPSPSDTSFDTLEANESSRPRHQRFRVLVYVHRPFIYTLLFDQQAPPLQITSFHASLHTHLLPLHKPLLRSTSLASVSQRIADSYRIPSDPNSPDAALIHPPDQSNPVFDLVHDPLTFTTHTSISNIPEPGTPAAEGLATKTTGRKDPPLWTRIEAINVHSQILNTLIATRSNLSESERTSKTSRGWWVVWLRIPGSPLEQGPLGAHRDRYDECRQAFLVRKASDGMVARSSVGSRVSSGMSMFGFGLGGSSASGDVTAAAIEIREDSQAVGWGLGIDARKYVESLLSLNR